MNNLEENQNLEDTELLKVKSDALRLLSFAPRSISELRGRLEKKGHAPGKIDQAIKLLEKQGLLNDEKFAKHLAQARVSNRPVGKKQLEIDLKKKGVSEDLTRQTLSSLNDYDEKVAAKELVDKRLRTMQGISKEKKKSRLYGLLLRRGFSTDTVFSVLKDSLGATYED